MIRFAFAFANARLIRIKAQNGGKVGYDCIRFSAGLTFFLVGFVFSSGLKLFLGAIEFGTSTAFSGCNTRGRFLSRLWKEFICIFPSELRLVLDVPLIDPTTELFRA